MKAKLLRKIRAKYHIGIIYDDDDKILKYILIQKAQAKIGEETVNKRLKFISYFWESIDIPRINTYILYARNRDRKAKIFLRNLSERCRLEAMKELESRYENKTIKEDKKSI